MASITSSTVETAVRERGDFPASKKFTSSFVQREIQAAWTALHRIVEEVHEGYFDKSGTVSTVANQAYVALPTDFRHLKGVDRLDSGEYVPLRQISIAERNRYGQTADEPEAFRLTERGLDLFPTPDAVYTLRVTYARKVTALGASAVEVDEEWQDYVIWTAIVAIATAQERPITEYVRQQQQAEAAIRGGASGRRQSEPEYLVLREYPPDWGWWF
jgi:hypothetical protein